MKILNVHERSFHAEREAIGVLIDSLSAPQDRLWPTNKWPAQVLDGPLKEGSKGGHAGVKYTVVEYTPGRRVVYQFDPAGWLAGIDGRHYFEVVPRRRGVLLRHVLEGDADPKTWVKWKVGIEPLHDALIEDLLDGAERKLHGHLDRPAGWSPWVKIIRRMIRKKRR